MGTHVWRSQIVIDDKGGTTYSTTIHHYITYILYELVLTQTLYSDAE
jgi:hypothetical protein